MKNVFLVNLNQICPQIQLDIRYATPNNFLGFAVYSQPACYLHMEAAKAFHQVYQEFLSMHLFLKIFDGYRPLSVQQKMWDVIQDERYIVNPAKNKGRHTRGTAIDLTLIDSNGNELEMPTSFDDFTEKAQSNYPHVSPTALENRALLQKVMEKHHFQRTPFEWWHFDFEGWENNEKFPPLDFSLEEVVNFDFDR